MSYESVFIIRQDVSSADVDKIIGDFTKIIESKQGSVVKTEYWGIRNLEYEILNNSKGHYVFLGINSPYDAIKELERKMKLSEDVIRFMTLKVDEISPDPSPILKAKSSDNSDVVDVTIAKDE